MSVTILHGNSATASTVWISQSSVLATELRPTDERRRVRASMDALTERMSLVRLVIVSMVMRSSSLTRAFTLLDRRDVPRKTG